MWLCRVVLQGSTVEWSMAWRELGRLERQWEGLVALSREEAVSRLQDANHSHSRYHTHHQQQQQQ